MTTINTNNLPSTPMLPPAVSDLAAPTAATVGGAAAAQPGPAVAPDRPLSTTGAAGEVPYETPSLSGTDWNAITNDLATSANLSVSLTQILTLLIEVMSEMRQDQREAALADAQNALQSGLNAADALRDAAKAALISSIVTNSATIVASSVTIAQSSAQLKELNASTNNFKASQDSVKSTQADLDAANTKVKDLEASDPAKRGPGFDEELKAARVDQKNAQTKADEAKEDWSGNKEALDTLQSQAHSKAAITNAANDVMKSLGNIAGSIFTFQADALRAEAKADEAQASYESSLAQSDQAFFEQLGQSISKMMQTLQGVESATHQAYQAIYNV